MQTARREAAEVASCQHEVELIYSLFENEPERDGPEEMWTRELAEQEWRMSEPGPGPCVTLGRRWLRRRNLRRQVQDRTST